VGSATEERVRQACATLKVYALQPDMDARGVTAKLIDGVTLVDYAGFVDLTVEHSTSHSWL
jgi:tRNA 2-thiouridine synthesizing protein B